MPAAHKLKPGFAEGILNLSGFADYFEQLLLELGIEIYCILKSLILA